MNILDDLLNYLDVDVPVRSVLVGAHWTVYYSARKMRSPSKAWLCSRAHL
jgi:hypothetical protein